MMVSILSQDHGRSTSQAAARPDSREYREYRENRDRQDLPMCCL